MSFAPVYSGVVNTYMAAPPIVVTAMMIKPTKTTINTFAVVLMLWF